MSRRALLIVNAGSSQGGTALAPCLDILREDGDIEARVAESESPAHVQDLIAAHGGEADMVIIAGGDGSMNAAVDALHARGHTLAILPLGTANDLARTLGIPADPEAACRIIARGRPQAIDLGRANGKLFFNVASIGAAVQLSRHLDRELKARWGVLSYPIGVRDVLDEADGFDAEIEDDDGAVTKVHSIQIAVGNGSFYGGGMRIAPDSAIDDQRLDLYSLEPQSLWRLVLSAPLIRAGRHDSLDGSTQMRGRSFTVRTDRPMDVSTDGEITGCTPVRFEVLPLALTVIVPPDHGAEKGNDEMIRDDRVVALDDVIVALKRSIQDMGEEAATHTPPDALTDALEAIAARRAPLVGRLEEAMRDLGDLPSAPDADRQAFSHVAARLKALLSNSETRALLDAALDDEDALLEAIDAALTENLPEPVKDLLRTVRADSEEARATLVDAADATDATDATDAAAADDDDDA